jgi:hypothetical protein
VQCGLRIFFLIYEVSRPEELTEQRIRVAASITPSLRSMSIVRGRYLLPDASWKNTLSPDERAKLLCHYKLPCCGRRAKRAGCGRTRSRNICFVHVPIAVYQGRQRRNAAVAGEEQHSRCTAKKSKYYWLYVGNGKLILAVISYFYRHSKADQVRIRRPTEVYIFFRPSSDFF